MIAQTYPARGIKTFQDEAWNLLIKYRDNMNYTGLSMTDICDKYRIPLNDLWNLVTANASLE